MTDLLKAAGVLTLAQIYIVSGIFFISGQFLPKALLPVYQVLDTGFLRTVVAGVLIFPLGNWGLAFAYQHYSPAFAAPMSIAISVLVSVAFTFLIVGAKPQFWLVPAIALMVTGCVWVSLLLNVKS